MKLKIKKLHPLMKLPFKGSKFAACADVYAVNIIVKDNLATIDLGFALDIPEGYKVVLVPRSSFTHKGWVMQNSPAQIDSDFKGEIKLKFEGIPILLNEIMIEYLFQDNDCPIREFEYNKFPYKVGDRVAQMFLEKVIDYEFEEVEELSESERNTGGFGSSGV